MAGLLKYYSVYALDWYMPQPYSSNSYLPPLNAENFTTTSMHLYRKIDSYLKRSQKHNDSNEYSTSNSSYVPRCSLTYIPFVQANTHAHAL